MKLSDMLFANAMMGEGGGGDTGTKWHVAISSVPVADNRLSANSIEKESAEDAGNLLTVLPYVDDQPYYGYDVSLESGYDNTVIFDVTDAYVPGEDAEVKIRFYYSESITVDVTGDIVCTHDEYDYTCVITGNGTITIS